MPKKQERKLEIKYQHNKKWNKIKRTTWHEIMWWFKMNFDIKIMFWRLEKCKIEKDTEKTLNYDDDDACDAI